MSATDQHSEPLCTGSATSSLELEISARPRTLVDGFTLRRLLPSPARRLVGPFIFFDHMGPVGFAPGQGLDVRPHPHINLATVTYLFEGEFLHRDSLGSEQLIRPGAINWMNAGRGIVHSERSPQHARSAGARVHGLQLWVALPRAAEESDPSFQHCPERDIPSLGLPGIALRVLAGAAYGVESPVRVLSALFYVEAVLEAGAELALPEGYAERAVYVVSGSVANEGRTYSIGTLLVMRAGSEARVQALSPARVVLIGGAPLDGPRHIYWNFVSSSPERIEAAKQAWREQRFPLVPGDDQEFIPLPDAT